VVGRVSCNIFCWLDEVTPVTIVEHQINREKWMVVGESEQKFYGHFFFGDYELDLVNLVALRQEKNELVNDCIQRFLDTRNRCFRI
jgi:hypothetical protein